MIGWAYSSQRAHRNAYILKFLESGHMEDQGRGGVRKVGKALGRTACHSGRKMPKLLGKPIPIILFKIS
jgi:hypothetical protein